MVTLRKVGGDDKTLLESSLERWAEKPWHEGAVYRKAANGEWWLHGSFSTTFVMFSTLAAAMVAEAKRRESVMKGILMSVGVMVMVMGLAGEAQAQAPVVPNPTPATTLLEFNHDGVDTDGYWLYVDGTRQTTALVVTTAVAPARRTPFPPLTRGLHNLEVTAFNVAGESAKSNTLSVRVVVIPTAPGSLHIQIVEDGTLLMQELRLRDGE